MSMQAINYALTLPVDEPGPRLLLILIAHHVNWKTGDMFVSQDELAEESRMSVRSIRNHLGVLEGMGVIIRHQQRDESGRRGVDRIELIGYLNWQHVLYHGGTIEAPATRCKKPPANSAASDEANRQNDDDQPAKSVDPTGNCLPVYKEPSLTLNKPLERASAPATQSAARPRLVKYGDNNWRRWINWLGAKGQHAAADAFEREGAMVVYASEPGTAVPLPKLPPSNPTKLGELEADYVESLRKGYRDPTGEHTA